MGRIPEETIQEVLARTDIVALVGQYVSLKRAGANLKGLCPFHSEKTPSFNVHAQRQIFKCFGCGAGGNVFGFVMRIEGWSFPESVRELGGRAGVTVVDEGEDAEGAGERAKERREAKNAYVAVMERARDFYVERLWGDGGERARAYLEERGVPEACAREFAIGWAPPGWENLIGAFGAREIGPRVIARAGLAKERSSGGGYYDRFRERVVFPVFDTWGNPVAFGGRVLPGDEAPKYLNSAETRFYVKGRELFGLHQAKRAIAQSGYALLVEGNFDVITLHGAGFAEAVAPMGTALTDDQARLLKRYAGKVLVAFDGDGAGQKAAVRALEPLERAGVEAHFVGFAPGDDPDSCLQSGGPEALRARIEAAVPLVRWALERELPRAEREFPIEERVALLERVGPILSQLRNRAVRNHYVAEVARRLRVDPGEINGYLLRPRQAAREMLASEERIEGPRLEKLEFKILAFLLQKPERIADFLAESLEMMIESDELVGLIRRASAHWERVGPEAWSTAALMDGGRWDSVIGDASAVSLENELHEDIALSWQAEEVDQAEKIERRWRDAILALKRAWAERSLRSMRAEFNAIDMRAERARWATTYEQIKQLEAFKMNLGATTDVE